MSLRGVLRLSRGRSNLAKRKILAVLCALYPLKNIRGSKHQNNPMRRIRKEKDKAEQKSVDGKIQPDWPENKFNEFQHEPIIAKLWPSVNQSAAPPIDEGTAPPTVGFLLTVRRNCSRYFWAFTGGYSSSDFRAERALLSSSSSVRRAETSPSSLSSLESL